MAQPTLRRVCGGGVGAGIWLAGGVRPRTGGAGEPRALAGADRERALAQHREIVLAIGEADVTELDVAAQARTAEEAFVLRTLDRALHQLLERFERGRRRVRG